MKKKLILLVWLALNIPINATFASDFLTVIDNVSGPITLFTQAIYSACYVIGIGFLFGSIVQYRQHRQNPTQVRISTPIFLLIAGIVLLFLPWLLGLSTATEFMR